MALTLLNHVGHHPCSQGCRGSSLFMCIIVSGAGRHQRPAFHHRPSGCRAAGRCRRPSPSPHCPRSTHTFAVSFTVRVTWMPSGPPPARSSSCHCERRLRVRRRPPLHRKGPSPHWRCLAQYPDRRCRSPWLAGSSLRRQISAHTSRTLLRSMSSHAAWSIDFDHCHAVSEGLRPGPIRSHSPTLQPAAAGRPGSPTRLRPRSSPSPPRPASRRTGLPSRCIRCRRPHQQDSRS